MPAQPMLPRAVVGDVRAVVADRRRGIIPACRMMRGENVVDARERVEMVEAVALVGADDVIDPAAIEEARHIVEMPDEIGLMLDHMRAEDVPEGPVDDVERSGWRDEIDLRHSREGATVPLRALAQRFGVEHVEIFHTGPANLRIVEGADLKASGRIDVAEERGSADRPGEFGRGRGQ